MEGPTHVRWQELCRQAAIEQDSKKLLVLIAEINRLLAEKEKRLVERSKPNAGANSV